MSNANDPDKAAIEANKKFADEQRADAEKTRDEAPSNAETAEEYQARIAAVTQGGSFGTNEATPVAGGSVEAPTTDPDKIENRTVDPEAAKAASDAAETDSTSKK